MRYYETEGGALAFTPATSQNENASIAQKYLERWGIDVVVYSGDLQANHGGVTERMSDAASFTSEDNPVVFISSQIDLEGLEVAFREGFHIAKRIPPPRIYEERSGQRQATTNRALRKTSRNIYFCYRSGKFIRTKEGAVWIRTAPSFAIK